MTQLLVKNAKIANSNNDKFTVFNFGIPAFKSKTGLKTCPMAGSCAKGCYATQGAYAWSNVQAAYEYRLDQTLKADFSEVMDLTVKAKDKTANKQNKTLVIRIHDSGDFYNAAYLDSWLKVINNNPQVLFYAYTKMIPLFRAYMKQGKIPANFTVIFSEGGISDNQIDANKDRHSRVFSSLEKLLAAGYADTTENDLNAIGANKKIGLVYHGAKSKSWNTNKGAA